MNWSKNCTLGELLGTLDKSNKDLRIQICHPDLEWNDFDEVWVNKSRLLDPFYNCRIACMSIEESIIEPDEYILRVDLAVPIEPDLMFKSKGR